MKMKIPLLDLKKQYGKIRTKINTEIRKVLESQQFILGPAVEALEEDIADYCGVPYAVGVASGTDALLLSLMALGVKAGDRVVTASFTFFATGGSISRLGAVPVFIDVDPVTYNMDPNRLEDYLGKGRPEGQRPAVLLPVHLFGQMADMEALMEIARRYGLRVVEDGAQALGAREKSKSHVHGDCTPKEWMAGAVGDFGCFSFFPSKNLGAFGDAGMVVTRDEKLAEKVRILRGHGSTSRYYHRVIGINSRLDSLQAAVLRVKLKYLDRWTGGRRRNADRYRALFKEYNLGAPFVSVPLAQKGFFHIYNQFVIRAQRRGVLREYLKGEGIGSEIYYPVPLHLQECYQHLGYRPGDLPESERAAREVLALPIYPELTMDQQRQVVRAIASFYSLQRTRSKKEKAKG